MTGKRIAIVVAVGCIALVSVAGLALWGANEYVAPAAESAAKKLSQPPMTPILKLTCDDIPADETIERVSAGYGMNHEHDADRSRPAKWVMNFGDDSPVLEADSSETLEAEAKKHEYAERGTYTMNLTVTHADGQVANNSCTFTWH